MTAEIITSDSNQVSILVTIPISNDMLLTEEAIQSSINEAGFLATQHALSQFDTDGC
jgi:hypothetical protein